MKTFKNIVLLLFFAFSLEISAQNDCVDAIFICGNTNLTGVETNGYGTQEISFTNACSSQENNSVWLKVKIRTGGTFGFLITPENPDLVVDLDFWIFGPNTTCGNLGTAIRCSTTNPLNAQLSYNITGMNETETDVSEGPGPDGNAFVNWITVQDNDEFYIVVDRPAGESNFAINWTGTATLFSPPIINSLTDLTNCESDTFPNSAFFDLTTNTTSAIGNQPNLVATFYLNYNDAVTSSNPITNPNSYQNTTNQETIYIRLTNSITNCFIISDFKLNVIPNSNPISNFSYKSPVCIDGINPEPILPIDFTASGTFSAFPEGLDINSENGFINLLNSNFGVYTISYSINQNDTDCFTPESSSFTLEIGDCIIPKGVSPNDDGLNDFFNLEKFDAKKVTIFNRYGINVYEMPNYIKQWNGKSKNGKDLPDGTYYYIVELNNGKTKTGWVYLNREY
jgi:gliding motility-associated-like protein